MSTLLVPRNARYLQNAIEEDLAEKMVFLSGPRQVGKTTLAKTLLRKTNESLKGYFNWDDAADRKRILEKNWSPQEKLIVLDEVHKFPRWRNHVKGIFDTQKELHSFLVTGSARLNIYRRGGDSMLGRYHHYRLHPFTLGELDATNESIELLLKFGGFPEPLIKQSPKTLRRWHLERLERLIQGDLRDLENVRQLSLVEQLAEALPDRVGAPLSIKNLAQDLEVDFKTVKNWLSMLENLYYCYRIPPFGPPKIRAVKKEQKLYLWDWSEVKDPGHRLENMLASHLLKYCHYQEDSEGHRMELRFLRDIDKREVDFVVLKDRKPFFAVECKTGDRELSKHIRYFKDRTSIPHFYQVHLGKTHRSPEKGITILPFAEFSKILVTEA